MLVKEMRPLSSLVSLPSTHPNLNILNFPFFLPSEHLLFLTPLPHHFFSLCLVISFVNSLPCIPLLQVKP